MKRQIIDQTLQQKMAGIIESYQIKNEMYQYKNDEQMVAAFNNVYQVMTKQDSLSNIMKLIRLYNKYKNDRLVDEHLDSLKQTLLESYHKHALSSTHSFEHLCLLLQHPIFEDDTCIEKLCRNEMQLPNNIRAILQFQKYQVLDLKYFNFILDMKGFHEKGAQGFAKLIAQLVCGGVKFEKNDIAVMRKIKDILYYAIANDSIQFDATNQTNLIRRSTIQIPGNINKLIQHNLFTPEIVKYLYASHAPFHVKVKCAFTARSHQFKESDIRIAMVDKKIAELINLNKQYPLKNNTYILRLFNHPELRVMRTQSLEKIPELIESQIDLIKNDYRGYVIYKSLLFAHAMLNPKNIFATTLPVDVVRVILADYCQLQDGVKHKKLPPFAFLSSTYAYTNVRENADIVPMYRCKK